MLPIPQTQIKMSHTLFKTYDFLMKKAINSTIFVISSTG
ncbi:conserved hypothetical protein [Xenorhabdus bovienii str. feltiae Florida]|nr:conserved hypothetical protein [Xenorhabdus bovienii str. feltiae France]CDG93900.1 conserved hypothetical protein [Xenorhabdus bovienii str. feltiae Florida]